MFCFLLLILIAFGVHSTIDVNLPELQYLADHLHSEECRKLVASLHFKSYDTPNALDEAEGKISKDVPCINLLIHWNSEAGEGRGETHEAIQHRLRQIGRADLADWLGKTVFHELGHELEENLNNPFNEFITNTEEKVEPQPTLTGDWNPLQWAAFDIICWVLLIGFSVLTFILLGKVVCILNKKQVEHRIRNRNYNKLEADDSSSESEDKFDIRTQDIKMHKIRSKYLT